MAAAEIRASPRILRGRRSCRYQIRMGIDTISITSRRTVWPPHLSRTARRIYYGGATAAVGLPQSYIGVTFLSLSSPPSNIPAHFLGHVRKFPGVQFCSRVRFAGSCAAGLMARTGAPAHESPGLDLRRLRIHENVPLSTQPRENERPDDLQRAYMLGPSMFSSDYPHWHDMPEELRTLRSMHGARFRRQRRKSCDSSRLVVARKAESLGWSRLSLH